MVFVLLLAGPMTIDGVVIGWDRASVTVLSRATGREHKIPVVGVVLRIDGERQRDWSGLRRGQTVRVNRVGGRTYFNVFTDELPEGWGKAPPG